MKKLFSTNYSDNAFNIAMFFLRVVAGLAMAVNHGYGKLTSFSKLSENFPNPYHLPSPVAAGLITFAEFFCSILLVLGLLSRFAALVLVIGMGTAFFFAHKADLFAKMPMGQGFLNPGEPSALFLVIFLAILLVGPGKFSADRLIGK